MPRLSAEACVFGGPPRGGANLLASDAKASYGPVPVAACEKCGLELSHIKFVPKACKPLHVKFIVESLAAGSSRQG